ncbi:MAG: epoxyqueuosine reductase QueH, partial [Oscillospiraceae bacterium]
MDYLALFDKELARARACTHAQLALHSCCAVCSSAVLELLSPHFEITVVYCNPNIFPLEEYDKRKSEQLRIIRETNWPNPIGVADLDYDHGEFLAVASGLESEPEGGKRCERCFELRMRATARYASEHSISLFCSTL